MAKEKTTNTQDLYNPTEGEKRDIERVYKRLEAMKEARSNYGPYGDIEDMWNQSEKQWEAYSEDEVEDWQSNIFIPATTAIIESQLAEVVGKSIMPKIIPLREEFQVTAAALKIIWGYEWGRSYSDIEHFKLLRNVIKLGTGIWQESFLSVPRTIRDLTKFDPLKGIEEYKERKVYDYYGVYGEAVDLFDFYPDDKARYLHLGPYAARDAIRRQVMDYDDFKETFKGKIWDPYNNAGRVKPGPIDQLQWFTPPTSLGPDDVEVLWYWSRYPDDALIIVANGVLIRSTPNPYKHKQLPFARSVNYIRTNQFYGKGDAELLRDIQEELNKLRRMRLDRNHLNLDNMFIVSSREVIDEEDLIRRPHGMIEVDDVNGIRELRESSAPTTAYLEEDRLKEDMVRVTGIDDRAQSVQKGGTATESAILREATLKRIEMKMIQHDKMFLPRVGRLRIANIQQFYTQPMAEALVGDSIAAQYENNQQASRLKRDNLAQDGDRYERRYFTVPLENKKLVYDKIRHRLYEEPTRGWTFFEAKPEFIRGNVRVTFEPGTSIPISKPLLQQRTEALLQHPLVAAAIQQGYYDLGRVVDSLVRVHELDPDAWKPTNSIEQKPDTFNWEAKIDPTAEIKLAEEQNRLLAEGKRIPPTPYITERHVKVHLAFANSPDMREADEQAKKNFIDHVVGEITLLKKREEASSQTQAPAIAMNGANAARSIGGPAQEGRQYPAAALQPSPRGMVTPAKIQGGNNAMGILPR